MKTTTNYGLIKPDPSEYYDVEQFNQNMDVIDGKIKEIDKNNVPNVSTNNQTPTYSVNSTLVNLISGEKLSLAFGKIAKAIKDLIAHLADRDNPHKVTASQVGALTSEDVINSLDSTSTDLPLSANQGKILANVQKAFITAKGTEKTFSIVEESKVIVPLKLQDSHLGYTASGNTYKFEISKEAEWDEKVTVAGGVVCPNSGFVLASGSVYFNGNGNERTKRCFILHEYGAKNDRKIKEECFQSVRDMGAPGGFSAGSKIISVQDGDILYLGVYSSEKTTCDTTHESTYLSVMYVQEY